MVGGWGECDLFLVRKVFFSDLRGVFWGYWIFWVVVFVFVFVMVVLL